MTQISSIGLYCLCGESVQMMAQAEPELEPLFSSYTKMKDAVTTSRSIKVTFECSRCGEVDVVGSLKGVTRCSAALRDEEEHRRRMADARAKERAAERRAEQASDLSSLLETLMNCP